MSLVAQAQNRSKIMTSNLFKKLFSEGEGLIIEKKN
jgi:hypothetical protein